MAWTTLDAIQERVRGEVVLNAPMAELTTLRVGGPADVLVRPADVDDLRDLLGLLAERAVPCFVLGAGSNLVVRDGGIRGAVVQLGEPFRWIEPVEDSAGAVRFEAGAGLTLRMLVRWAVDRGVAGFEALSGIPGTVGGAVAMNAGAWGTEMADRLVEVRLMVPDGTERVLGRGDLRAGYRHMDLPEGAVVVSAVLEGTPDDPEQVKARTRQFYQRRRDTQPVHEPSAGSVFKNPPGHKAARLIEACGLKGVRVGDAEVSRLHANFIVNTGKATAGQVVALMGMIRERVYVKHRVQLEPEVRIVGEWAKGKIRVRE